MSVNPRHGSLRYKKLFLLVVSVVMMTATAWTVANPETLADSAHADTEACTNVACRVWRDGAQCFEMTLELMATPSNCVEVAFGTDTDGDGVLGVEEIALAMGWDCGCWCVEPGVAYFVQGGAPVTLGLAPGTDAERKVLKWEQKLSCGRPRGISVSENGVALVTGCEQQAPDWFFDRDWNMMRVTVRGVDRAAERVRVSATVAGFMLTIR